MNQRTSDSILHHLRNRYFGKYRGIVENNKDDDNRGRLLVKVQDVLDELTVWALPCLPYAGKGMGTYWLPEPGAGVWIEFEGGDISYPIWTGGYWADKELPKDEESNEAKPSLRMMRSEKGLMITFNDESEKITISDKDGKNKITIEVNADGGKIRIEAKKKVVVQAPKIELVENSTHPLVFGDNLYNFLNDLVVTFNAHLHPGQMAVGVLPVTPAPPVKPLVLPPKNVLLSNVSTTG